MEQKKILIVDDDVEILELLSEYLERNGLKAFGLTSGEKVSDLLAKEAIDLIILDIMLPGEDGYDICKRVRSTFEIPIIMLTARTDEVDKVLGLEIGADDYLEKPFSSRELLARIKAVLRRVDRLEQTTDNQLKGYSFFEFTLETGKHQLVDKNGVVISLSGVEFNLLKVFLDHPNQVLSRDMLLDLTQGREANPFDRAIDVQISRLRQKLGDNSKSPKIIKTVRSEGYIFIPEVKKHDTP